MAEVYVRSFHKRFMFTVHRFVLQTCFTHSIYCDFQVNLELDSYLIRCSQLRLREFTPLTALLSSWWNLHPSLRLECTAIVLVSDTASKVRTVLVLGLAIFYFLNYTFIYLGRCIISARHIPELSRLFHET